MKLSDVLIKPILTEKANAQSEKLNKFAFRVSRKANKLEIKDAIEAFYNVSVKEVHTIVIPAKSKTRFTKAGYIQGQKPSYKKAYVTVAEGDTINLYGEI